MPSGRPWVPTPGPGQVPGAEEPGTRRRHWPHDPMIILVAGLFLALLVVAGALALSAPQASPAHVLPLLLTIALYVAAGLVAWRWRPHNRIGVLMLLAGLSIWASVLDGVADPVLSMLGLLSATLPLALTLHLLMAFPSGRVEGTLARVLVVGVYLASTLLQLPLVLVGTAPPAVWRPPDAARLVLVASWVQSVVGVSSVLAAAALVAVRAVRADPVERRLLGPMVWYRVLLPLLIAIGALTSQIRVPLLMDLTLVQFVGVLGLPVVFLVGLLQGSFGRAGQLDELVTRIGGTTPDPGELTAAVAQALGDPGALVVYARSDGEGFVDEAGGHVSAEPSHGRRIYPVQRSGRTVGGIVHREDLITDHSVMDVLGGIVAMGIDAQRLVAEQRALLAELQIRESDLYASRRRLLQAEDSERRRISRDLHDGAQQHIVLLGLSARQLSRRTDDPEAAASAASIADGMTGLLNEFRDFVAGIMPAPLLERGLVPAVELLAERMPVPTTVEVAEPPRRLAADAESTLYFTVSEALTNVAKHASATSAQVRIDRLPDVGGPRLRVTVRDDGVGGADLAAGRGLSSLQDRVAALGGTLVVESPDGGGTLVGAEVPCA
jgi:signal transduction histidine kinase